jgi:hypothetical protein
VCVHTQRVRCPKFPTGPIGHPARNGKSLPRPMPRPSLTITPRSLSLSPSSPLDRLLAARSAGCRNESFISQRPVHSDSTSGLPGLAQKVNVCADIGDSLHSTRESLRHRTGRDIRRGAASDERARGGQIVGSGHCARASISCLNWGRQWHTNTGALLSTYAQMPAGFVRTNEVMIHERSTVASVHAAPPHRHTQHARRATHGASWRTPRTHRPNAVTSTRGTSSTRQRLTRAPTPPRDAQALLPL